MRLFEGVGPFFSQMMLTLLIITQYQFSIIMPKILKVGVMLMEITE